ncbi:MAG: aminotransferase class III-fold pyridoxal phosphate-dependent enzyme [Aestuariivirga sp.]|uniref:aminotransferase n=1 Tax=Aestuariivirga sp. TaxID=2650926 RepID=UPI0025C5BC93|nr:aminotransferase [Aestuariivirga sp.]MCA3562312.1 aminotransferase class III-fold pyridoxal phosphate-dependent enzyme [Aestuariivirga sp.]
MPLSNMAVRDIETVIHPYTNLARHREVGPLILNEGRGIYLYDDTGKRYIEGMAGLWCTALGYGNQEIAEAGAEALRKVSFTHAFGGKSHDGVIALSEKLKEIAPCPASKVLFGSSGSEANDMQIKLSWYYNNARGKKSKKKIISRIRAYHGVTIASASLTGLPWVHNDFDLPIANVLHTSCPHYYRYGQEGESEEQFATRMAQDLEDMILREGPDTIAAFIGEPLMGAGGVLLPPTGYWEKVNAILEKYDIRFIADEVICGFGRTGNWFGSTTYGMTPHSISMAKAITSAYFPLSALTVEEDLYQAMLDESRKLGTFGHGYTYTAHPVGCAISLKTIEIYQRDKIMEHAARMSPVFQTRLRKLAGHPLVGEARGVGLIGAVELVADKATKRPFDPKKMIGAATVNALQEMGLIVRNIQDSVALCPPLVITTDEIHEMFDIFERGLDQMEAWARKENARA